MIMSTMLSEDEMFRAHMDRDVHYDGLFILGVKTTGIFCRPTCPARKALRKNLEFFQKPIDALHAGYRPCKRCEPMDGDHQPPEWVVRLRDLVDASPTKPLGAVELRARGIDPTKARRYFKTNYGMTFAAYHRARRMGMALSEIRQGHNPDLVALRHGFDSISGFRSAFVRTFGYPPGQSKQLQTLTAKWIDTPLGAMVAVASDQGLHLLEFVERRILQEELAALRARFNAAIVPGTNPHLVQVERELGQYFAGQSAEFRVRLTTHGTEFQEDVWRGLLDIPLATTWSYAQLARHIGRPKAVRAVGRANGANPVAIIVPCHRVIGSNGTLVGYGGKLWRKEWLLEHEAKMDKGTASSPRSLANGQLVLAAS